MRFGVGWKREVAFFSGEKYITHLQSHSYSLTITVSKKWFGYLDDSLSFLFFFISLISYKTFLVLCAVLCFTEHSFAVHGGGRCICTHIADLRVHILRRLWHSWGRHPFFLLSPIAKPHSNHLFLQLQVVR